MPATDEEILEVNETDMHIASDACQTVGYLATDEEILEVNETDMHIGSNACQTVGYLATDEENLEVKETNMHIALDACQIVDYLPAEGIPSQLSQIESSEGLIPMGLYMLNRSCLKPYDCLALIILLFSGNICFYGQQCFVYPNAVL